MLKPAYSQIVKLDVTIGGFHEGYHEFDIHFKEKRVVYRHFLNKKEIEIPLHEAHLNLMQLQRIGILDWDSAYNDSTILDGEQWALNIQYAAKKTHKYGSNKYPDEWNSFCLWLQTIIGENIFRSI